MTLPDAKYYFVSDVHLRVLDSNSASASDTARFIDFLKSIPSSAKEVFLLGDIFDFWVEYKHLIPKGYTRVLGELAVLVERGVKVHFFPGNHDYWTFGYLEKEIGMNVHFGTYIAELEGKRVCLAHGDGLGRKTIIDFLFKNKICIAFLKCLPASWIFPFAHRWSANSRKNTKKQSYTFQGTNDPLYEFATDFERKSSEKIDFFIFGHIHRPARINLPSGAELVILGDWQNNFDKAIFCL